MTLSPTLPARCECDRSIRNGERCLLCGRQVIATPPTGERSEYRHAGQWPKRVPCERCGAAVLKARHAGAGRPAVLDVQETSNPRSGEGGLKVYLDQHGVARAAPTGWGHRRTGEAVHRRHHCPGEPVAAPKADDGPGLLALAHAVGPPLTPERLYRGQGRRAA